MTRQVRLTWIVAALFIIGSCLPVAAEDLTVISTVTANRGKPLTSSQYITSDKIRTSDGRYDSIVDIASGKMIHIDHKKKSYYETTMEELHQQLAEVDKMLDENPMMGAVLGDVTAVTVEKGSGQRTVAGYSCQQYLLTMGAKFQFEIWAADGLKAPVEYHDAKKIAHATMGPMASRFDKMYEAMKEIDGFPLVVEMDAKMVGFKIQSVSEATEVRKGPIPAGTFDPPAGYKKKKSPYQKKK